MKTEFVGQGHVQVVKGRVHVGLSVVPVRRLKALCFVVSLGSAVGALLLLGVRSVVFGAFSILVETY